MLCFYTTKKPNGRLAGLACLLINFIFWICFFFGTSNPVQVVLVLINFQQIVS